MGTGISEGFSEKTLPCIGFGGGDAGPFRGTVLVALAEEWAGDRE